MLLLLQEVLKLGAPRFLVDAEGDAEVVVLLEVFEFGAPKLVVELDEVAELEHLLVLLESEEVPKLVLLLDAFVILLLSLVSLEPLFLLELPELGAPVLLLSFSWGESDSSLSVDAALESSTLEW